MKHGNFAVDTLEARRLFAATPVAINFNDEALWDENFATAVQQAKALGVQSVRVWFGFDSYDRVPNAWDPVSDYGAVTAGEILPADGSIDNMSRSMARAFQLKRAGFTVLAVLQNNHAMAPDSAAQVKGLVRHLMDATETPDGTQTLKDVIDYWEIGNETDSATYWAPSGVNKTAGLKAYVDNYLIPAAEELHLDSEPVVSAGPSYSPNDLNTIIGELKAQNAMAKVDYLGFHPYGAVNSTTNDIAKNTALAVGYANAVGKKLIATEWNVRGFGNYGTNDAVWAATMDKVYRETILPNYEVAYYFALVNNWAARGGSTSARPGGLLKHDTTLTVTPTSDVLSLRAWYKTPVIAANPFYTTFNNWQYGQISGSVVNQTQLPAGMTTPSVTVYLDTNNNGAFDTGEQFTTTDSAGTYNLQYSMRDLAAGAYTLRIATPDTLTPGTSAQTVNLTTLAVATNVNFSVAASDLLLANIGVVSGTVFVDTNVNGLFDAGETGPANLPVWMDLDNDGLQEPNEPSGVTTTGGAFSIAYDIRLTGSSPATLRVVLPAGTLATTAALTVTPAAGAQTNLNAGYRNATGSISGYLWNDSNGDGLFNTVDTYTGARVVYLDQNQNGKLDAGEVSLSSDANSNYSFTGLAAGTYYVTRVFPAGYKLSNNATGYVTVVVGAGQTVTGVNIGTTSTTTTIPTDPGTPTNPGTTGTPAPAGTGSIAGKLFASSSAYQAKLWAAGIRVFLDSNGNGTLDSAETYAVVNAADGTYKFSGIGASSYTLAMEAKAGWAISSPTAGKITINLTAGANKTGQNFVVKQVTTPTTPTDPTTPTNPTNPTTPTDPTTPTNPTTPGTPAPTGTASIAGKLFASSSAYQAKLWAAGLRVYLDNNKNGKLDSGENFATVSATDGTFKIGNIGAGTYTLSLETVSGWAISSPSTGVFSFTLKDGAAKTGQNFIVKQVTATTTPTTGTGTTTPGTGTGTGTTTPSTGTGTTSPATGTGSIAGKLFTTSSGDTAAAAAASWSVFMDANANGKLDSGEIFTAVKSDLTYAFANLAAGNYRMALATPAGWGVKTPSVGYFTYSVTNTTAKTGQNFVVTKA